MELGIISLSDLKTSPDTGHQVSAAQRIADTIDYAVLADHLGLDVFAVGEHHNLDYAVSSPAVVLAAAAARTQQIRLTSGVTVLSALDPVRVYQDFAQLDLVSNGRAEIIAGRSAFVEPFALFGHPVAAFEAGTQPGQALMIGSSEELVEKILDAHRILGIDRFFGQFDWGALPRHLVEESIYRLATEIAPAVRANTSTTASPAST